MRTELVPDTVMRTYSFPEQLLSFNWQDDVLQLSFNVLYGKPKCDPQPPTEAQAEPAHELRAGGTLVSHLKVQQCVAECLGL